MKNFILLIRSILLFLLFSGPTLIQSQETDFYEINDDDIFQNAKDHVYFLSAPSLLGRSALTGHDQLASFYIDSIFNYLGLNPIAISKKNSRYQKFRIVQTIPINRNLQVFNRVFEYGRDFVCLGPNPPSGKDFEIVFGGLGEYDDIAPLDLNGKALLILSSNLRVAGMKVQEIASSKGCSAIIIANPSNPKQFAAISRQLSEQHNSTQYKVSKVQTKSPSRFFSRFSNPTPQVLISEELAKFLLGEKPSNLWQRLQKENVSKNVPKELTLNFDFNDLTDTIPTQNVIGWLPSATGSLQSVVVCAHFDHLAPEGQLWYPGADDNASGLAVMLEVARLFSNDLKNGYKPLRNIVFAAFTAEEMGLLGSQHYTLNPLFPLDSTRVVFNFDMLGRMEGQEQEGRKLFIGGSNRLNEFNQILSSLNSDTTMVIDHESLASVSLFTLSDHYHFENKGIPAFLLTTGLHSDYHKTTDTPEKLSYENMLSIVRFTYQAIKHFADTLDPWELNVE